jgi:hypothetical protein
MLDLRTYLGFGLLDLAPCLVQRWVSSWYVQGCWLAGAGLDLQRRNTLGKAFNTE